MDDMTISDAIQVLQAHEIECDQETVHQWITEGKLKATRKGQSYTLDENDVIDFLVDLSRVGTAYEKGIDDKTKIERLEEEIVELKREMRKLADKNVLLEFQLGIGPFN